MEDLWLEKNVKVVKKGWGEEHWIVNSPLYCSKILIFNKDSRCSFHYHLIKNEHFHLLIGKVIVKFGYEGLTQADEIVLNVGDTFAIPVGLRHQVIALEYSEILENSTSHYETDSYRIVKGD